MKKARIVVVGSINMDLMTTVPQLPVWGECLQSEDFHLIPGGKGANQALGAARAGAEVALVGRVGADPFGQQLRANLEAEGANVKHLKIDPDALTGVALILLDRQGRNCIVVTGGANMRLIPDDISAAQPLFSEASTILVQLEVTLDAVRATIQLGNKLEIPVLLDPAPARSFQPELMKNLWTITPNETEASGITGIEVKDVESAGYAAQRLVEMGVTHAVVKLGEQGAVYSDGQKTRHCPGFAVEAVDSTAAGDAFAAALAVALGEGKDWEQALQFANAAGALSVTKFGAQPSMPWRQEIEHFQSQRSS